MTRDQLDAITERIKEEVWRNSDIMFAGDEHFSDALDILTSLHNLLYEEVTGHRYNYAFHWVNKIGAIVEDNVFYDIMEGGVKK